MIIEEDDIEFEYPKDYSYKIELMNAGFQHLQFQAELLLKTNI
ncbi:hypothetical protein ACO2FJ_12760 [Staphylococcus warneri]